MKQLRWTAVLVAAAVLLAGCGEIQNTLTPQPGTANVVTVALDAPANFSQVGIFEAEALGYLTKTDIEVRFITPADPLAAIEDGQAQIAISNEPAILLARNAHVALASVAAILQGPQRVTVSCKAAKGPAGKKSGKSTVTTTAPRAHPPLHPARCRASTVARPDAAYASAPTYNGLNFVVTENEIINHAAVLRRFIQAVARGYAAVKSDPETATADLVKLNPSLDYANELAGVKASLSNFFPATVTSATSNTPSPARPWGWQSVVDWNAFGSWLLDNHTITNVNATPDADTNELLAGQGV